jgi:hypothetical protein
MGTELALYWSVLSKYTSSVISAYFLPLRGVLGAGEGGRLWPSRSRAAGALLFELSPAMVIVGLFIVVVVVGRIAGFLRGVAMLSTSR